MILAGDVGGTNSRLGIFDDQLKVVHEATKKNAGRASFQDVVREFLYEVPDAAKQVKRSCFGVAGPVADGRVTLTNLNWEFDERALAKELNIPRVALINDLVAHAEGVELLTPDRLITLNPGVETRGGNRAIIAAGTGLGEAGLLWDARLDGYRAVASEGGHADFSPRTNQEWELARFLRDKFGYVSWEHVLSGPGICNLYEFIITPGQLGPFTALPMEKPTPAEITQAATQGSNRAAVSAIDLFAGLYGAAAGNLTLTLLAVGGLYIGGGIGLKIVDQLKAPTFLDRFQQRGPEKLRELLKKTPVHLINCDLNALYGAANYASRL